MFLTQTVPTILIGITILTKSDMVENNRNFVKVKYNNVAILLFLSIDFFFLFFFFFFSIYMLFVFKCI